MVRVSGVVGEVAVVAKLGSAKLGVIGHRVALKNLMSSKGTKMAELNGHE